MSWPSSTSPAARTSLVYITLGALIVIWTGVWYLYLHNNPPVATDAAHVAPVYYWCGGLGVTGAVLIVIGLAVGRVGTSARQADLPHAVVTPPVVTDAIGKPVAVQVPSPAVPVATTPTAVVPAARCPPPHRPGRRRARPGGHGTGAEELGSRGRPAR